MTDDPSLHSLNSKDVWLLVRGISSISTLPLTRVASLTPALLCVRVGRSEFDHKVARDRIH